MPEHKIGLRQLTGKSSKSRRYLLYDRISNRCDTASVCDIFYDQNCIVGSIRETSREAIANLEMRLPHTFFDIHERLFFPPSRMPVPAARYGTVVCIVQRS